MDDPRAEVAGHGGGRVHACVVDDHDVHLGAGRGTHLLDGGVNRTQRRSEVGFLVERGNDDRDVHSGHSVLATRAIDLLMGLLHVRGWIDGSQEVRVAYARDWTGQWWKGPLGREAFVIESALRPTSGAQIEDLEPIMSLAIVAWRMEHEFYRREQPIPDLMLGCGPGGVSLASIHPEPWRNALREVLPNSATDMEGLGNGIDNRSHAYVEMHLAGSSIEPWSLPGSACAFGTANTNREHERVYVALRGAADEPDVERTRTLLRLMLASGTE